MELMKYGNLNVMALASLVLALFPVYLGMLQRASYQLDRISAKEFRFLS